MARTQEPLKFTRCHRKRSPSPTRMLRVSWSDPRGVAGKTALLIALPGLLYGNSLLVLQGIVGFASEYVYIGRPSPAHWADKALALTNFAWYCLKGFEVLSRTSFVAIVLTCSLFKLLSILAILREWRAVFDVSHTGWHVAGLSGIVAVHEAPRAQGCGGVGAGFFCDMTDWGQATRLARWALVWACARPLANDLAKDIAKELPPSGKKNEDDAFVGQKLHAWGKSVAVVALVTGPLLSMCARGRLEEDGIAHPAVEVAGVLFTSFEVADVFLGRMTPTFLLHHAAYAWVGLAILKDCRLAFLASSLLLQELSGVFLGPLLVLRHRMSVPRLSRAFALSFALTRLVIAPFVTLHHFRTREPGLDRPLVDAALCVGTLLQLRWAARLRRL